MVLTIGHSNHSYDRFVELLRAAGADVVLDIRSVPYSRRVPHFNSKRLPATLARDGIEYRYLGGPLGGRPSDPSLYRNGHADYERMAQTPGFLQGLEAVESLERAHRPALMCAERDPLDCHRCLLVARALAERAVSASHIMADGALVSQQQIEDRLLAQADLPDQDLFATRAERLASAFTRRAGAKAYRQPAP